MFAPENGQQQWDKNDTRAGDESGFCGRGVLQTRGLEGVSAEHEDTEGRAGEKLFPFQVAKDARAKGGHENCGQRKADGEKEKNGSVVESAFYDDESCAPEQGAQGQREIGFGALGIFDRVRGRVAQGATE